MSISDLRDCMPVQLLLESAYHSMMAAWRVADATSMIRCGAPKHCHSAVPTARVSVCWGHTMTVIGVHTSDMAVRHREVPEEQAACQDVACARQQLSCRYPGDAEGPCMAQSAVRALVQAPF